VSEEASPRTTSDLFGHVAAEQMLLEAYKSGRIAHAWLIGGPPGIGKATLAYRFARFVLAHPDPGAAEVQSAASLTVDPAHPVARRMAAQGQPDFFVLERVLNEQTGKLYTQIRVEDVRRLVGFFGATAREGGWRVAIVDSVDELAREGANALLKVLEEPPARALLLLVSHSPGRELPTIRSRCRRLLLRPLAEDDVRSALAMAAGRQGDDPDVATAAAASDGSVARALAHLEGEGLALREQITAALRELPTPDPRALHSLADKLAGTDPQVLATFLDLANGWLSQRVRADAKAEELARVAEAWERINTAARDVADYNLDRRPFVFSTFAELAAI
jgi:DNA polymerase III subunit delta'